jgi:type VI secretion system protein ImpC
MHDPITFDSIDASMYTDFRESREKPQPEIPFRILIMGDFSGRANRGVETDGSDMGRRTLYKVDRDNDETVMSKLAVSVSFRAAGGTAPPIELTFSEMDDFHPQQIYFRTDIFKTMKDVRGRLIDPDTFVETAAGLSGRSTAGLESRQGVLAHESPDRESDFSGQPTADLLDQVLDASSPAADSGGKDEPQTEWDRFLGDIVGPHLVPDIGKEQAALVGAVDGTISDIMRNILHHPDFQAVEAAWRGLQLCLRGLETSERLQVYLLDVSKSELVSDLTAHEDLRNTAFYKKLALFAQQHSGQAPWALLAGMYTFSPQKMDAVVLAQLGAVGQMVGAPFIGRGDTRLVGCPSMYATPDPKHWTAKPDAADRKAWQVVRRLPEAKWIGLAMPRFVLRLPYGEATDPVDAFAFEEMLDPMNHEHYLWTNPIFALVLSLGRTYRRHGWDWSRGLAADVSGLPLHLFADGGEQAIKPCAEVLLKDKAIGTIIEHGLMPLVSFKDRGQIQLARFQSIADPLSPLSGRWVGLSSQTVKGR